MQAIVVKGMSHLLDANDAESDSTGHHAAVVQPQPSSAGTAMAVSQCENNMGTDANETDMSDSAESVLQPYKKLKAEVPAPLKETKNSSMDTCSSKTRVEVKEPAPSVSTKLKLDDVSDGNDHGNNGVDDNKSGHSARHGWNKIAPYVISRQVYEREPVDCSRCWVRDR